jgi:hypothetical protein
LKPLKFVHAPKADEVLMRYDTLTKYQCHAPLRGRWH